MDNPPNPRDMLFRLGSDLQLIKTKLSMPDSIIQIQNSKFYLPNFPEDLIQKAIVINNNYFDSLILKTIDEYIPDNANIIDAGANIGNHTLYWAVERNANHIYSFEPLDTTFQTLKRNLELNDLTDKVTLYNVGLYNEEINASIETTDIKNIGHTVFKPNQNGKFSLKTMDSYDFGDKIDLLKIDVEGAEIELLEGAKKTIEKYRPVIVIECFKRMFELKKFMKKHKYKLDFTLRENEDFIYIPTD